MPDDLARVPAPRGAVADADRVLASSRWRAAGSSSSSSTRGGWTSSSRTSRIAGGLTETAAIAELARARAQMPCVPHAFKTGILLSASFLFAASLPNGTLVEYTASTSPLARDLAQTSLTLANGSSDRAHHHFRPRRHP